MPKKTIDRLIVTSPYTAPTHYWHYDRTTRTFDLVPGRRKAGYVVATEGSRSFDDPGVFYEIPLVNQIRPRVRAWRDAGYPGITGITRRLLDYWQDTNERGDLPFFFCQIEAIETLIWLTEAPATEKTGIDIPGDGGAFLRQCCKMATGTGKTVVMAMLIAWQILNKTAYPTDPRFSRNVLVIAPGLTVKSRLSVLVPSSEGNYYDVFNIVPPALAEALRQGTVLIRNWQALAWETEEQIKKRKNVDKRGPKSDEAYVREILGDMARHKNLIIINDEAHHAWRVPAESKVRGIAKDEIEQATIWVQGLDRVHAARNIISCFDFTATPFAPSGKKSDDEALFTWIVSDFSLNDAIESGLVKTPRVVIRDDTNPRPDDYKSRFYHIYTDPEVYDNLNRKGADESEPLPDLLNAAYYFLGLDWQEKKKEWETAGYKTPPVMITVANTTETAARINYAFTHRKIRIADLCDRERILHIDSKVLKEAEAQSEPLDILIGDEDETRPLTKKEQAQYLRQQVDTIGKPGEPGENIQNVISVGMLSEGWDARTVTHIMGLRAFSSQLLCEQVIGRGLRRTSYDVDEETRLFSPEYVNIFGIPFTFLPHEEVTDGPPKPEKPKTRIESLPSRREYEIAWPNVLRVEHTYRPALTLDIDTATPLILDAAQTPQIAELAPIIDGKPDVEQVTTIDLEQLSHLRLQQIIFETARDVLDQMRPEWRGNAADLIRQLIGIVDRFLRSDKIKFAPLIFSTDDTRRRVLLILNMNQVVQHIYEQIREENTEAIEPVLDRPPLRSTAGMPVWYTTKPCGNTAKSQINACVFDSTWEATEAFALDRNPAVQAWAKNDHLGFEIFYLYQGVVRRFRPDFLIRLANGEYLVLETKGQDSQQNRTKRAALAGWVRAVNAHGGFGTWHADVSFNPADVDEIVAKYARAP
ncbi:MAG: type restriction enzyme [Methanofollis sp.]|nr:type restriction enzyme [Methanofollis sp.]